MSKEKCISKECQRDAFAEVFWPGSIPVPKMCSICALKASAIAKAMGFEVEIRKIYNNGDESDL